MSDPRARVIAASELVEAIRPERNALPWDLKEVQQEDLPVVQAWDKARNEFRAACAAYMLAQTELHEP